MGYIQFMENNEMEKPNNVINFNEGSVSELTPEQKDIERYEKLQVLVMDDSKSEEEIAELNNDMAELASKLGKDADMGIAA